MFIRFDWARKVKCLCSQALLRKQRLIYLLTRELLL